MSINWLVQPETFLLIAKLIAVSYNMHSQVIYKLLYRNIPAVVATCTSSTTLNHYLGQCFLSLCSRKCGRKAIEVFVHQFSTKDFGLNLKVIPPK